MKTKYLFTLALASSLAFAGCEDLDTMPSGGTVTSGQKEEVAESLPERAEAGVTAIFAQFSVYWIRVTHPCAGRRQLKQASTSLPLDLHVLSL